MNFERERERGDIYLGGGGGVLMGRFRPTVMGGLGSGKITAASPPRSAADGRDRAGSVRSLGPPRTCGHGTSKSGAHPCQERREEEEGRGGGGVSFCRLITTLTWPFILFDLRGTGQQGGVSAVNGRSWEKLSWKITTGGGFPQWPPPQNQATAGSSRLPSFLATTL